MSLFPKALLISVFIVVVLSQTIPINNLVKNLKPANCLQQDEKNNCVKCLENYSSENGKCIQITKSLINIDSGNQLVRQNIGKIPNQINPCKDFDGCGRVKNFKNDQEQKNVIGNLPQRYRYRYQFYNQANQGSSTNTGSNNSSSSTTNSTNNTNTNNTNTNTNTNTNNSSGSNTQRRTIRPGGRRPRTPRSRDTSGPSQIYGVEKDNIFVNDGTYIYTISNQVLSIIQAYTANNAKLITSFKLTGINSSAIFIEDNYLAIIGRTWQYNNLNRKDPTKNIQKGKKIIWILIYILILREYQILYNTQSYAGPHIVIKIYDITNRGKPFQLKEFQVSGEYLNGRKLDNGLIYLITDQPYTISTRPWFDFGSGKQQIPAESIFTYSDTYISYSLITITSLNLKNPANGFKKIISILNDEINVLYLSNRYIYFVTSYKSGDQQTAIRKILIRDDGQIKPFRDIKIQGSVNNQFSMDQHQNYFRIATSSNIEGSISNNLFILDEYLNVYGSLTDITPGGKILFASFVGKRCYLQIVNKKSPFIVINIENYKKPIILSQLKLSGYSKYMVIYDENTVLGIDHQNAPVNGTKKGLKIALFDVSNIKNLTVTATFDANEKYVNSISKFQERPFLFLAEKNILVIPASLNSDGIKFNGAFVFEISKNKINLRTLIDHLLNSSDKFQQRNLQRSLNIGKLLYTKSKCLLRINQISSTYETIKTIDVPCSNG